jgi:soluble lytic murein transglycosylase
MKNPLTSRWVCWGLIVVLILLLRDVPGWSEGISAEEELDQALAVYEKGEYLEALKIFQRLEEENPLSPIVSDLLFMQGQALRALHRWPEAAQVFSRAAGSHPLLADYALYYQGEAWQAAGEGAQGLTVFKQLILEQANSLWVPYAQVKMAELYLQLNAYYQAVEVCENFLKENPREKFSGQALFFLGQAQEGLEQWSEAAKTYQDLWLKYPLHPSAPKGKSRLEAIIQEKKIILEKIPPEALLRRSWQFYQAKLYDAWLKEMDRLEGFPPHTYPPDYIGEVWMDDLYFHRGMCFFYLKQYNRATEAFRLVVFHSPNEEMVEKSFFFLIRALYRLDRKEEALQVCDELQKTFPGSTGMDRVLYLRAQIHENQGDTTLAVSLYREITEKYPDSSFRSEASWQAGWLLFKKQDFGGALQAWSLLLKTCQPDSLWLEKVLYWRGKCFEMIGQVAEAEESYQQLSRQFPASFYTQLAFHRSCPNNSNHPAKGDLASLQEQPLPSFIESNSPNGFEQNGHLEKSKDLVRLGFLANAAEELEAAEGEGSHVEGLRLEIARLYRKAGNHYRSAQLVRKNYPLRSLVGNLTENEKKLYLLAYPLGDSSRIHHYARERNLDPALLTAVILEESRFNPLALSRAGARGLMQILPVTAKHIAPTIKLTCFSDAQLFEPEMNLRLGSYYFAKLLEEFEGKETLALAAYNAGPQLVREWMAKIPSTQEDEFVENIPYPETRHYVLRVISSAQVYRTLYGVP